MRKLNNEKITLKTLFDKKDKIEKIILNREERISLHSTFLELNCYIYTESSDLIEDEYSLFKLKNSLSDRVYYSPESNLICFFIYDTTEQNLNYNYDYICSDGQNYISNLNWFNEKIEFDLKELLSYLNNDILNKIAEYSKKNFLSRFNNSIY